MVVAYLLSRRDPGHEATGPLWMKAIAVCPLHSPAPRQGRRSVRIQPPAPAVRRERRPPNMRSSAPTPRTRPENADRPVLRLPTWRREIACCYPERLPPSARKGIRNRHCPGAVSPPEAPPLHSLRRLPHGEPGVLGSAGLPGRAQSSGPFAVLAPRPAAGSALTIFQLLLGPTNSARSGHLLFGVLDPADELVAGQGRDVLPGVECRGVGGQRLA